jgi:hypothetical protein
MCESEGSGALPSIVKGRCMDRTRETCVRCGDALDAEAGICRRCDWAPPSTERLPDRAAVTGFLDTIHLPPAPGQAGDEKLVRPALAVLFRMAVGPAADYYAPRFLEYERTGHSFPSWNWASLWLPSAWAFYRKLWVPGFAFALWPLAGLAAFGAVEPHLGDSDVALFLCAGLLLWALPGVVAALAANSLLYRRVRNLVRNAEDRTTAPEDAAGLLASRTPIALGSAAMLGAAAVAFAFYASAPRLQAAHADRVVRSVVAEGLAALEPLKRQVEAGWALASPFPPMPDYTIVRSQRAARLLEAVSLSPANGRLRLALGELVPELSGRSILLAPTIDREQHVRWICIPVDVPARYLPEECQRG